MIPFAKSMRQLSLPIQTPQAGDEEILRELWRVVRIMQRQAGEKRMKKAA